MPLSRLLARRGRRAALAAVLLSALLSAVASPAAASVVGYAISPTSGPIGTTLHVSGRGCVGPVTFAVENGPGRAETFAPSSSGTFSFGYEVPPAEPGRQTADGVYGTAVVCDGERHPGPAFTITAPTFTLSPAGAAPGATVTFTGLGCFHDDPNRSDGRFTFGSAGPTVPVTSGPDHRFTGTFTVPDVAAGTHTTAVTCLSQGRHSPSGTGGVELTRRVPFTVTRYAPLASPARLMDTRGGPTVDGRFDDAGPRAGGTITALAVAGRAGLPADAPAVALNVTAVGAAGEGFVTVFPCGRPRPTASNLNHRAADVVANAVITAVGTAGRVCLFTSTTTHVVVDAVGALPSPSFVPLAGPARLLDTRDAPTADGQHSGTGPMGAGSTMELPVAGRSGIGSRAQAVALTVTAVHPATNGFVTVFPCGQGRPNASNLNVAPDRVIAGSVAARLGSGGRICLYTSAATHLIVDAAGTLPTGGFLSLATPARLMDTRDAPTVDGQHANTGRLLGGTITELSVAGRGNLPSRAAAVTANVTVIDPIAEGYVTVFPCGQPRPVASTVNFRPGDAIANAAVAAVGAGGRVCLFTSATTHLVVDVSGTLT